MLRLTDTRTRRVEEIVPSTPGLLTVYACGPTVYRYAHVGNLRTFLLTDLVRRTAEQHGLRVRLVQNITDVGHMQDDSGIDDGGEDKLLAQARLEDRSPFAVARFYEDAFHADLRALNVHPADAYPRASEWIDSMLALTQKLVDAGNAYVGDDGTVYFDGAELRGLRRDQRQPAGGPARRPRRRAGSRRRRASASTPTGRCGSGPARPAR